MAGKRHDQQQDKNQPQDARRAVTPIAAIVPGWKSADEGEHDDNEKECRHAGPLTKEQIDRDDGRR
jgi:hypothetical protein